MKSYIVYNRETGEIIRSGVCADESFYLQAGEGEAVRAGEASDQFHIINTDWGTIEDKPEPPGPTLEEVKGAKTKEIKAAFNAAFFQGYTTQGLSRNFKIDCRRTDKDNIESIRRYMIDKGIATTRFRTFDNEFVEDVTVEELGQIASELVEYGIYLYGKKWALEDAVNAAQTIEEVEAIQW